MSSVSPSNVRIVIRAKNDPAYKGLDQYWSDDQGWVPSHGSATRFQFPEQAFALLQNLRVPHGCSNLELLKIWTEWMSTERMEKFGA